MFDGKEYVYAVYEEKSFSKAAQKLYITQPALSTAIKKVEKKIGTPIFDRSTSPIGLTPGGEVLITILAAMAEQESRTMSTNIKWTYQKKEWWTCARHWRN